MSSEKNGFRSHIFGGFNKKDVVAYITKLAAERNKLKDENEGLSKTATQLREQFSSREEVYCLELEQTKQRAEKAESDAALMRTTVYEEITQEIKELEEHYYELCAEIEKISENIKGDLHKAGGNLDSMVEKLNKTGEKIEKLYDHMGEQTKREGTMSGETENGTASYDGAEE